MIKTVTNPAIQAIKDNSRVTSKETSSKTRGSRVDKVFSRTNNKVGNKLRISNNVDSKLMVSNLMINNNVNGKLRASNGKINNKGIIKKISKPTNNKMPGEEMDRLMEETNSVSRDREGNKIPKDQIEMTEGFKRKI